MFFNFAQESRINVIQKLYGPVNTAGPADKAITLLTEEYSQEKPSTLVLEMILKLYKQREELKGVDGSYLKMMEREIKLIEV